MTDGLEIVGFRYEAEDSFLSEPQGLRGNVWDVDALLGPREDQRAG